VTDICIRKLFDININLFPVPFIGSDFFAKRTKRQNSPQGPDLIESTLQVLIAFFQLISLTVNVDGVAKS
jgi:hypothetical protein